MNDTTTQTTEPGGSPLDGGVRRLGERAAYDWPRKECPCKDVQHGECLTLGCKWERDPSLVPQSLRRASRPIDEGELWSWVRSVMSQGADIRFDYEQGVHKGYEAYSARLDAAAAERAEELAARLKTPNVELSGLQRPRRKDEDGTEVASR